MLPFILFCPTCKEGILSTRDGKCNRCGYEAIQHDGILVLDKSPTQDYPEDGAAASAEVDTTHFWYAARNRFIQQVLLSLKPQEIKGKFAEFGCGNGYVMNAIEKAGWDVVGIDMHLQGLKIAQQRTGGTLICSRMEKVRFAQPLDAVGMFDLIEHLEDDLSAIRHAVAQLRQGGYLLITVPALQALWSKFDLVVGHKRRYDKNQLRRLIEISGLRILQLNYLFFFAVFPIWLQRLLTRSDNNSVANYVHPPISILNNIFKWFSDIELKFMRHNISLPLGTSLIAVAQRI